MERIIFHIDVNSAFLSWEACYRIHHLGGTLDLCTIPSAVSGTQDLRIRWMTAVVNVERVVGGQRFSG